MARAVMARAHHPRDRARVDEALAFVLRYLSTDTAPAEGAPKLSL